MTNFSPREIWPLVSKYMVDSQFRIISDQIVPSDTDPDQQLRKVTAHFYSQELAGKKWGHPCVIFLPQDNSRNQLPQRKGKVVIVGSPPDQEYLATHVAKYGEPIAARTGYPTMVLANPGRYPDGGSIESDIRILSKLRKQTGKNSNYGKRHAADNTGKTRPSYETQYDYYEKVNLC